MPNATWKPHEKHGRLTAQTDLPDSVYAFPKQRKEPLTDAQHVRNAVARFDQVIDVSDADRALAFANIEKSAKYYNVNLAETSWHEFGIHPQKNRRAAAAKGAVARKAARGAENPDSPILLVARDYFFDGGHERKIGNEKTSARNQPRFEAEWRWVCRMPGVTERLVVSSPSVCGVWAHRMLRQFSGPACVQACGGNRASDHCQLRAG